MVAIEQLAFIFGAVGTIATGFFAWRGKKEDTAKNHDDSLSEMFAVQGNLVKGLSSQVAELSIEIEHLRKDNGDLTQENKALRKQVEKLTIKIDELMKTA
ncbi:hypothetical protein KII97_02325 [Leuconostoc gelidum subsp. gasicomitatum]|uniref:hypothetical protein n=1 Tax=Leuconostoc gasicomitatum TaxID=115778 RepID=UPI001CC4F09E|nr:hypothetical protein [Leuconostoc gasicomitatum]MBZ5995344.1 hypothetical protein [Leuconostoc gasicomitatum]